MTTACTLHLELASCHSCLSKFTSKCLQAHGFKFVCVPEEREEMGATVSPLAKDLGSHGMKTFNLGPGRSKQPSHQLQQH